MKLQKILKSILRPLAGVLACALLVAPVTARAAVGDPIDATKSCAVSLVYKDRNGKGISGMRVSMYQMATVKGEVLSNDSYTLEYALTPEFAVYDEYTGTTPVTGFSEAMVNEALWTIYTKEQRSAWWQAFAVTLAPYAEADMTPDASQLTPEDGKVTLEGLDPGLYLLIAEGTTIAEEDAEYVYTYQPTVVALPQFADGEWVYGSETDFDLSEIHPKCSYERIPTIDYEYSIFKRWLNDDAQTRPASILVDIYRDGELHERVDLNEGNNWRYDWKSKGGHRWSAIERTINRGYSVTMNITGTAITFTNTYTPPEEIPPGETPPPPNPPNPPENIPPRYTPPDREVLGARRTEGEVLGARRGEAVLGQRRLPQSGQLWWPVPVLMCAGVGFILAGMVRRRKED